MIIDSPGGNTNVISPIVELFKLANLCGKEVTTVGLGTIASSAASVFVSGNRRILFPNAEFLIHRAHICIKDDEDAGVKELRSLYERTIGATDVVMNNIYAMTKITPEIVEKKLSEYKDWFLTAEEIRQYGITTEDYSVELLKEIFVDDSKDLVKDITNALQDAGFKVVDTSNPEVAEKVECNTSSQVTPPDYSYYRHLESTSYGDYDDECDYEGD